MQSLWGALLVRLEGSKPLAKLTPQWVMSCRVEGARRPKLEGSKPLAKLWVLRVKPSKASVCLLLWCCGVVLFMQSVHRVLTAVCLHCFCGCFRLR